MNNAEIPGQGNGISNMVRYTIETLCGHGHEGNKVSNEDRRLALKKVWLEWRAAIQPLHAQKRNKDNGSGIHKPRAQKKEQRERLR